MSISFPTQGHHVIYMCSDVIFQILPPCSRLMISHHVTCHVTAVSRASSLSKRKIKEKRKENQYKIRKIKEKKNKIVSVQMSHNSTPLKVSLPEELLFCPPRSSYLSAYPSYSIPNSLLTSSYIPSPLFPLVLSPVPIPF